jgi:mannose-1-phosphate guanylyltransferase
MKAVVLVGGEGTRLRPLTETIPKPLIPLVDRPFLHVLLDRLGANGVTEAILSSPYLETAFEPFLAERTGPPAVTWITEATPLGTGGAVANAAATGSLGEAFAVLNGDILTDLDLGALLAAHREAAATATIALAPVDDARPYGLVEMDETGRVLAFREKPTNPVAGNVNIGAYVLEPEAVRGVRGGEAVSIEREVYPGLIASGALVQGFVSDAYWRDLGTPESYLQATFDVLEGRVLGLSYAAPHVSAAADVSLRAHLGRWVVVGPDARVGDDAEVEDSVLLAGALVGRGARVVESIIGPGAAVGAGAIVEGAILAEGAVVPAEARSAGARIGPGQTLEA